MSSLFDYGRPRTFAGIPSRQPLTPLQKFQRNLERGKTERFTEEMDFDPETASFALSRNPENRIIKKGIVRALAQDMSNDAFVCNGEPIIMSDCGHLNDGQHRLIAIVESGKTVRSNASFGYERDTRMSIDSTQAARTTADYLHMDGIDQSSDKAKIGSVLRMIEANGCYNRTYNASRQSTQAFCFDNLEDIEDAMEVVTQAGGKRLLNRQTLGALYILFKRGAGVEPARYFMEKLQTGVGLAETNVIWVLRERLIKEKGEKKKGRDHIDEMMHLVIRAWNHYRSGTTTSKMLAKGHWPPISR